MRFELEENGFYIEAITDEYIVLSKLSEDNGKLILNTVLSSGTSININPMLLIGALVKNTNTDEQDVDVIKIESYTQNMEVFK